SENPDQAEATSTVARQDRYKERREIIEQAEDRVESLLGTSFSGTHRIETGVRVGDPKSPILDVVARSTEPDRWTSFAVEIRLVDRSRNILGARLRQMMLAVAIAARNVPEGQVQVQKVGRPPV